jgi:acyl-CoA thioester hydrolase
MGRTFTHRFRVRWGECDPQNIVFNAHYVAYFDMAITELWREALGGYTSMVAAGTDMVVAEANVRYLGPAGFDDELEIEVAIAKIGTTSITSAHTVRKGDDVVVEGWLRHVFIDAETKRKTPIPESIRAQLQPYAAVPSGEEESAADHGDGDEESPPQQGEGDEEGDEESHPQRVG